MHRPQLAEKKNPMKKRISSVNEIKRGSYFDGLVIGRGQKILTVRGEVHGADGSRVRSEHGRFAFAKVKVKLERRVHNDF